MYGCTTAMLRICWKQTAKTNTHPRAIEKSKPKPRRIIGIPTSSIPPKSCSVNMLCNIPDRTDQGKMIEVDRTHLSTSENGL